MGTTGAAGQSFWDALPAYIFKNYSIHIVDRGDLHFCQCSCQCTGNHVHENPDRPVYHTASLSRDTGFSGLWQWQPSHVWHAFTPLVLSATYTYNRIMINVCQGTLTQPPKRYVCNVWKRFPSKYFDTHAHGDIMSIYTNDIDTLRQMISQSYSTADILCDHDRQCAGQYADPEYTAYCSDPVYGRQLCWLASQKLAGLKWKIFHGAAEEPWYCKRLYRRDDGGSEGCQGLLP